MQICMNLEQSRCLEIEMNNQRLWDCIIGGGPAGLTAALYLARYRRTVLVFDNQKSRALSIPNSHNYPGFPQGISGKALLERLSHQVLNYKVTLIHENVESLQNLSKNNFVVTAESGSFYARTVLLCTGVKDIEPLRIVTDGIKKGLIRYCPVCDAFEVINKKIAVIGDSKKALMEAIFLSDYSSDITLLTLGRTIPWSKRDRKRLNGSAINVISESIMNIDLSSKKAGIIFSNEFKLQFDCIYSALGCIHHNKLANDVHAKQKNGRIIVNKKQQTSIPGLYAAGDIVSGLNQICVATAEAAIATNAIHHLLKK